MKARGGKAFMDQSHSHDALGGNKVDTTRSNPRSEMESPHLCDFILTQTERNVLLPIFKDCIQQPLT